MRRFTKQILAGLILGCLVHSIVDAHLLGYRCPTVDYRQADGEYIVRARDSIHEIITLDAMNHSSKALSEFDQFELFRGLLWNEDPDGNLMTQEKIGISINGCTSMFRPSPGFVWQIKNSCANPSDSKDSPGPFFDHTYGSARTLKFLHAHGDPDIIAQWLKFAYHVALGKYPPNTKLDDLKSNYPILNLLSDALKNTNKREICNPPTIASLFTKDHTCKLEKEHRAIELRALGSVFHILQDHREAEALGIHDSCKRYINRDEYVLENRLRLDHTLEYEIKRLRGDGSEATANGLEAAFSISKDLWKAIDQKIPWDKVNFLPPAFRGKILKPINPEEKKAPIAVATQSGKAENGALAACIRERESCLRDKNACLNRPPPPKDCSAEIQHALQVFKGQLEAGATKVKEQAPVEVLNQCCRLDRRPNGELVLLLGQSDKQAAAYFEARGQVNLSKSGAEKLRSVSELLNSLIKGTKFGDFKYKIIIRGYTDPAGVKNSCEPRFLSCFTSNPQLAILRATNVAKVLSQYGVSTAHLMVQGIGIEFGQPAAGNASDRRVEIALVPLMTATEAAEKLKETIDKAARSPQ